MCQIYIYHGNAYFRHRHLSRLISLRLMYTDAKLYTTHDGRDNLSSEQEGSIGVSRQKMRESTI